MCLSGRIPARLPFRQAISLILYRRLEVPPHGEITISSERINQEAKPVVSDIGARNASRELRKWNTVGFPT